jgi:hypothetical protein
VQFGLDRLTARGDHFGHYMDMPLAEAIAMLRNVLEQLEPTPEVDRDPDY